MEKVHCWIWLVVLQHSTMTNILVQIHWWSIHNWQVQILYLSRTNYLLWMVFFSSVQLRYHSLHLQLFDPVHTQRSLTIDLLANKEILLGWDKNKCINSWQKIASWRDLKIFYIYTYMSTTFLYMMSFFSLSKVSLGFQVNQGDTVASNHISTRHFNFLGLRTGKSAEGIPIRGPDLNICDDLVGI